MTDIFTRTIQRIRETWGPQAEAVIKTLQALPHYQIPLFLRDQGMSLEICEIAYYESLKDFVENEDHGQKKDSPSGYTLNSSLQWMEISSAAKALNKDPGMYVMWKNKNTFYELSISKKQAQVLDQLMDDLMPQFDEADIVELNHFSDLGIVKRI